VVERFRLKVLTPMFMGGANPRGEPELRAASIRGAMRFWFRAIAGAVTSDPREVYRLESEVFGNTERKSKVVVRVKPENIIPLNRGEKVKKISLTTLIEQGYNLNFLAYWANMGLTKYGGRGIGFVWSRYGFKPDTTFYVEISSTSVEIRELVSLVFQIAVHFGGFGSRWRHGFGSCEIQDTNKPWNSLIDESIRQISSFAEQLGIAIGKYSEDLPLFATLKNVEIFEGNIPTSRNWINALTWIGLKYREFRVKDGNYRRFGHTRDYLDFIKPIFNGDRVKEPVNLSNDIFGLPIQFTKRYKDTYTGRFITKTAMVNVENKKLGINRRATPLILHVEPDKNLIRATIFHAKFLPERKDTPYFIDYRGNQTLVQKPISKDYERITEFVENFLGLRRRFSNVKQ